jgi:hypothetical protein
MAIEDIAAQNLSPYLQWLLSRTAQAQGAAPAPQPLAALQTAVAPPNPVMIQALGQLGSAYGGDLGRSLREAQRGVPGSFRGANVFGRTATPDIASLMQQPATISSQDALAQMRAALNIGNFQFADMSRENINAIADRWEELNELWAESGDALRATRDTVSGKYGLVRVESQDENGNIIQEMVPIDPSNPLSVTAAGLFNRVINGDDPGAIIEINDGIPIGDPNRLNLDPQLKADLKDFGSQEEDRVLATDKIRADQEAFARTYELPSFDERFTVPPEVAGLIYQRQKTGLTDVQAAAQEADVTQARYEAARTGYVPRTADQLRKEAMAKVMSEAEAKDSRYADTTGRVVRGINPATERKARLLAEKAAQEVIGSPDRMESAASRAYNSVMRPTPALTAEQQKEIDRMVQEGIWAEGTKAMRGVMVGGGDEYAESQRAKRAAQEAILRELELSNTINQELESTYGSPAIDAIIRARAIVNANSKNYGNPSSPITSYPRGFSGQVDRQKPQVRRMSL